jgi:putative DNA primase/helicase
MICITKEKVKMSDNLDTALQYADLGWYVHPCKQDKKPYTRWGSSATTDAKKIRSWWKRWPDALIGIACEKSGLWALDVDNKNGVNGSAEFERLITERGDSVIPSVGPVQVTPSGGMHLLFKATPGVNIPNNASKIAPGLDLRYQGYVCSGGPYRWQDDHGPDTGLIEAPGWLLDLATPQTESKTIPAIRAPVATEDAGAHWLDKALERTAPGRRNDTAFWLAGQLRDHGLTQDAAEVYMIEYAKRCPQPGKDLFTEDEAIVAMRSAYSGAARGPAVSIQKGIMPMGTQQNAQSLVTFVEDRFEVDDPTPPITVPEPTPPIAPLILLTELGNSRRFSMAYRGQTLHVSTWGWMIWNKRYWEMDETGKIMMLAKKVTDTLFEEAKDAEREAQRAVEAASKLAETDTNEERDAARERQAAAQKKARGLLAWAIQSQHNQKIKAMLSLAESDLPAKVQDFDKDPWLLNCKNGIVDLRTGQLQPHSPSAMITKIAGTSYDPNAQCPTWLTFLDRIFAGNTEVINFVQRAAGLSLTGEVSEQCFLFLYGEGANGKSTFLGILEALLGDYFKSTRSENLMVHKFGAGVSDGIAMLMGARCVVASELERNQKFNEPLVKQLTGGDSIAARRLYKDEFTYRPVFKLWMYGNEQPQIIGTDEGIWRRLRLVPFTVTIPEKERDPKLKEKIVADELPGILNWALEGCRTWQEYGLGTCQTITKATEDYRKSEDVIGQFISECCLVDKMLSVGSTALYAEFQKWGGGWSQRRFGDAIGQRFERIHTRNGRAYVGLGLLKED